MFRVKRNHSTSAKNLVFLVPYFCVAHIRCIKPLPKYFNEI